MGMISRYQKPGGFLQLLQLIETCGKQKQDNFLKMIEQEDPNWAQAIKEKMITIEKLFSWDDAIIAEISGRLQQLTLATAMHGLKEEENNKLLRTYSHSQRRLIEDLNKAKNPVPSEISSAFIKIIQETRNMISQGYLRPDKFAPALSIPDKIEEILGKNPTQRRDSQVEAQANPAVSQSEAQAVATPTNPTANGSGGASDQELQTLRVKLRVLTTENSNLKTELKLLRDKISQIKKIA